MKYLEASKRIREDQGLLLHVVGLRWNVSWAVKEILMVLTGCRPYPSEILGRAVPVHGFIGITSHRLTRNVIACTCASFQSLEQPVNADVGLHDIPYETQDYRGSTSFITAYSDLLPTLALCIVHVTGLRLFGKLCMMDQVIFDFYNFKFLRHMGTCLLFVVGFHVLLGC